jgi:regulator of protease activity HflC (stomatin/prohibitin superfamily)
MKANRFLQDKRADAGEMMLAITIIFVVIAVVVAALLYPMYNVWKKEKAGEASLREAEWSKKIAIEEAKAAKESASLLADAEIERAKGVARSNEIIGDSLKGNDAYLRYLWINGLHDGSSEVIYIPTEANLPILEAGRSLKDVGVEED